MISQDAPGIWIGQRALLAASLSRETGCRLEPCGTAALIFEIRDECPSGCTFIKATRQILVVPLDAVG